MTRIRHRAMVALVRMAAIGGLTLTAACHGLLDVSDPTLVQDSDIANPAGADARRLDVQASFEGAAASLAKDVAIFTDEWTVGLPTTNFTSDEQMVLDRRDGRAYEAAYQNSGQQDPHLGDWDNVFTRAAIAIPAVRAYSPDSLRKDFLAELFAIRGYTVLQIAEDICPGFPINDVVNNQAAYSMPFTTDSAVRFALAQTDSAMFYIKDSARFANLARVTQGRAYLDLGDYAHAAAAVASVPTEYVYLTSFDYNPYYLPDAIWNPNITYRVRPVVGDREGGNGLPFVSANDPRVQTKFRLVRAADSVRLYSQAKYPNQDDAFVVANGIEARLIEAEAALANDDPSWVTTLNTLRATMISPAMSPIPVDSIPSDKAGKVDLLYRERAFWLYLNGRRLGDLRRLMRNYGRAANTVFPTGAYPFGPPTYSDATAIPFVEAVQKLNPNITTGCTTR